MNGVIIVTRLCRLSLFVCRLDFCRFSSKARTMLGSIGMAGSKQVMSVLGEKEERWINQEKEVEKEKRGNKESVIPCG